MQQTTLAITFDMDWAPECAIRHVVDMLLKKNISSTWFITHDSASLKTMRKNPKLFELGIHPNFYPGSSHGETEEEVMETCLKMVPEARSMRAHGLWMTSGIIDFAMQKTPIEIDVSTFMPGASSLEPALFQWHRGAIWKVPYFWEDDLEFSQPHPQWDIDTKMPERGGLAIFNFHPIHIYLNTANHEEYAKVRNEIKHLPDATKKSLEKWRNTSTGTGSFFQELLKRMGPSGGRTIQKLISES